VKSKRTLYEIFWEVLTYCRNPRTFTNIIQECSLNSKIGQEHIDFLLKKGFLLRFEENGQNLLRTTERAKPFLDDFKSIYFELFNQNPKFKLRRREEIGAYN
jgi:predicted transcriptional regulator